MSFIAASVAAEPFTVTFSSTTYELITLPACSISKRTRKFKPNLDNTFVDKVFQLRSFDFIEFVAG